MSCHVCHVSIVVVNKRCRRRRHLVCRYFYLSRLVISSASTSSRRSSMYLPCGWRTRVGHAISILLPLLSEGLRCVEQQPASAQPTRLVGWSAVSSKNVCRTHVFRGCRWCLVQRHAALLPKKENQAQDQNEMYKIWFEDGRVCSA